jgi:hypothetical protein
MALGESVFRNSRYVSPAPVGDKAERTCYPLHNKNVGGITRFNNMYGRRLRQAKLDNARNR